MFKLRHGLVLAAAVAVVGCGDNDPTGPDGSGDWLPLAVGNQWVYAVDGMWVENNTDADTTWVAGASTITVTGQTTHAEGFDLFVIRDISSATITSPDTTVVVRDTLISYAQSDSGDVYLFGDTTSSYETLEILTPLLPANTWHPYPDADDITRTVTSVTLSMTVPAGSFTGCAQLTDLDLDDPGWSCLHVYARGVGQIHMSSTYSDSDWTSVDNSTLVSYTVDE